MLKTITPRRSFNMDDLPKNDGMTQIKNNETRYVATNTFFTLQGSMLIKTVATYSSNEHSVLPLDVRCTGVQFNSAYEILALDGWKSLDEVGLSAKGITVQGIDATIDEILGV